MCPSLLMRFRHVDSSEQLQRGMFVYILKNHGSLVPMVVLVTFLGIFYSGRI